MRSRYCKCGNEMLVIKKEFAWYWCGKCGRFLNGDQNLDPGDEWLEPLSSHAVLGEVRAMLQELGELGENMAVNEFMELEDDTRERLLKIFKIAEKLSEHFS